MLFVGQGVSGVGIATQRDIGPAGADFLQHLDVPAGLHLDLDALIAGRQLSFDLLQQLVMRILNADADAASDFAP